MKPATYPQLRDVGIRFLNLSPDGIDGEAIQKGLEGFSNEEVNRRLKAFLNNGLSFIMKGLSTLLVDRTKPFNPTKFIGDGWTIWRGRSKGKGLEGNESQDTCSLGFTEIDFAKVLFTACLEGDELIITGEQKLARHIAAEHICLDAKIGQCLFEEKDQTTLEWLHYRFGIAWLEFPGTVLRNPRGDRYFLCLFRGNDGRWERIYPWLDGGRLAGSLSAVLAN